MTHPTRGARLREERGRYARIREGTCGVGAADRVASVARPKASGYTTHGIATLTRIRDDLPKVTNGVDTAARRTRAIIGASRGGLAPANPPTRRRADMAYRAVSSGAF